MGVFFSLALVVGALLAPPAHGASALQTLASTLRPGQWAPLTSATGLNGAGTNILTLNSGHIFEFGHKATWDAVNGALYYYGVSHHGNIQGRFIKYDEASNAFSVLATTANVACCGSSGALDPNATPITPHSYDHHVFARGNYFHRAYNSATIRVWDGATQTWQAAGAMPGFSAIFGGAFESVGSLEYFPDWGANGSLLYYDGGAGLGRFAFNAATGLGGSWSKIVGGAAGGGGQLAPSGYSNISAYSPKKKVVLFGGGTPSTGNQVQNIFKVTDAGAVSQLANLPCNNMSTTDLVADRGSLIPDPITGHFILLCSQSVQYLYNVDANNYTAFAMNLPFTLNPSAPCGGSPCYNIAFQPIHAYDVILFLVWNGPGANAEVWVYKPNTDWVVRSTAPGVVRAFNFDTTAEFTNCIGGTNGCYGADFGIIPPNSTSDYTKATRDTAASASGASSLRFTIPTNSGADMAGSWHANFSSDLATQFGAGQTFYTQWRQMFSDCLLFAGAAPPCTGPPRDYFQGGGWKHAIISAGDLPGCTTSSSVNCRPSCSQLEIVPQNSNDLGFLHGYHGCPGSYNLPPGNGSYNFESSQGGGEFWMQNAYSGRCPFSQTSVGNISNCFRYVANEWMTFMVGVTVGSYTVGGVCGVLNECYPNSTVEFWAARAGQPFVKTHSFTFSLNAVNGQADKWGKIWLTPYNSQKSAVETHPEAYTWYDELIISTQPIAAPGALVTFQNLNQSGADNLSPGETFRRIGPGRERLSPARQRKLL